MKIYPFFDIKWKLSPKTKIWDSSLDMNVKYMHSKCQTIKFKISWDMDDQK